MRCACWLECKQGENISYLLLVIIGPIQTARCGPDDVPVLHLGSNVSGKKGEMRVPEEQAVPHQTEDSGI